MKEITDQLAEVPHQGFLKKLKISKLVLEDLRQLEEINKSIEASMGDQTNLVVSRELVN